MGWTYLNHRRRGATVVEELERQCLDWNHLPEAERPVKIAHATGNGVVAFAVRFPAGGFFASDYVPDADGTITAAVVVLFRDGKEFGWKSMDEMAGPYHPVSASILKHLSKLNTDNERTRVAQRWRDDCRAYSAAKAKAASMKALAVGTTIKTAAPLSFHGWNQGCFTADTFRVQHTTRDGKARTSFRAPNGALCRLPASALATATIDEGAPS